MLTVRTMDGQIIRVRQKRLLGSMSVELLNEKGNLVRPLETRKQIFLKPEDLAQFLIEKLNEMEK